MSMSIFDMIREVFGIKKKLRRIYPANDIATYDIDLECGNCDNLFVFAVPKGTSIENYIQQTRCPNCETKNLKKKEYTYY